MALDLRAICSKKMKLHQANAIFAGKSAVTPSRYPEFAMPDVAQRLDGGAFPVKIFEAGYERHQINDWLGGQSRHRGGADMMDADQGRLKNPQIFSTACRHARPSGIMGPGRRELVAAQQ